ncbi:MAG: hypothetical protein V1839_02315 [archaeon]
MGEEETKTAKEMPAEAKPEHAKPAETTTKPAEASETLAERSSAGEKSEIFQLQNSKRISDGHSKTEGFAREPAKKKTLKPASEALIPLEDVKKESPKPKEVIKVEKKHKFNFKIFGRWSTDFPIMDQGLKPYLNIAPYYMPFSAGRSIKKQFWKSKKSIIERLMGKLLVPGHKGKKHVFTSGVQGGKTATVYKIIKKTFEIVETKTKKNPVEVFVRALEVGSPREGVATIEYGGVRYPKAADLAPQRRIDLALRWMTQGAFMSSRKNKKHIWDALAEEIIVTANNDVSKSMCITKRLELERQASASR